MRKALWLCAILLACQPLPSEPREPGGGVIFEAYYQQLLAQIVDEESGGAVVNVGWVVINGTTGQVIGAETLSPTVPADGLTHEVMPYASDATAADDPNRMRKLITLSIENRRGDNKTMKIRFYIEKMSGRPMDGTYPFGPNWDIPNGGSLMFTPEQGWVLYDGDGRRVLAPAA